MGAVLPGKPRRRPTAAAKRSSPIRLIVFDVDGVLTDGTVLVDASGGEWKRLRYHDFDAIAAAQASGVRVAFLSGESGPLVESIAKRFRIDLLATGAKDKAAGLRKMAVDSGVPLSNICYIGDADRDVPALTLAAVSLVPRDASPLARRAADHVLRCGGGEGVAAEVLQWLAARRYLETGTGT